MFKSIKWVNPEHSIIALEREDGSIKAVDSSEQDLWIAATSGKLGPVQPYVAPPPPPLDMVAAEAIAFANKKYSELLERKEPSGLARIHAMKLAAANKPNATSGALISAEARFRNTPAAQVISAIQAKAAELDTFLAMLEESRINTQERIKRARSIQEVDFEIEVLKEELNRIGQNV